MNTQDGRVHTQLGMERTIQVVKSARSRNPAARPRTGRAVGARPGGRGPVAAVRW